MTAEQQPLEYRLRFPEPFFCRWDDDGAALVWPHGVTIAFREEVLAVAERIVENLKWLPPPGALALFLAACRENWGESPSKVGIVAGFLRGQKGTTPLAAKVFEQLDVIHQVWQRVRHTRVDVKAELAVAAFGRFDPGFDLQAPHLDPADIREFLSWDPESPISAIASLRLLENALAGLEVESFAARFQTGIEQAADLAPAQVIELPPPETGSPRELIRALEEDLELAGIARLARRLLAAIELPLNLSDPDELQQGGVSDIANRGPLDRLLLSELAHDDLTLAVRVAMREALYLRRETPPRPPARRRAVLIDVGLRTWGVPRVFATSVALALAAADERGRGAAQRVPSGLRVDVYRRDGADVKPVDFSTREGLLDHLQALDDTLHPGAALAALLEQLGRSPDDEPLAEIVVVADEDALADRGFQRQLEGLDQARIYLAAVNREGDFLLAERTPHGRKIHRRARFDLDEILAARQTAPKKRKTPPLKHPDRGDLPAIFHVDQFPLWLPQAIAEQRMGRVAGYGVVQLARDGRLLLWTSPKHGAQQLAEHVPGGRLHWLAPAVVDSQYSVGLVTGKLSRNGLTAVTFDHERGLVARPMIHDIEQPLGVTGRDGLAFVYNRLHIAAVDLLSGELVARRTLPEPCHWCTNCLFQSAHANYRWYAAGFDGHEIQFARVPDVPPDALLVAHLPSDTLGRYEGFACLTLHQGLLTMKPTGLTNLRWQRTGFTDPKQVLGIRVAALSRDGARAALTVRQKSAHGVERESTMIVDLGSGEMTPCRGLPQDAVEAPAFALVRPRTMRHRFEAVAVNKLELILIARDGQRWPIQFVHTGVLGLARQPLRPPFPTTTPVPFQPLAPDARSPYDLRVARFADGSRVFLDSRGLLHLASSDPAVPECSLVLCDGESAGWAADGAHWGHPYFHAPGITQAPITDAFRNYVAPFLERLRCN